jgi:hypothetical protein
VRAMARIPQHKNSDDADRQAHGFTMGRCPECDRVHLAMVDENDEVIAEMVMTDDDWRLALVQMAKTLDPRDAGRMQ